MIILTIYLIGVIVSYLLTRYWWKKTYEWTIKDRLYFGLACIMFSWFAFLRTLVCLASTMEDDKPAKW